MSHKWTLWRRQTGELEIELWAADVGAEGEEAGRLAVGVGVAEIPAETLVGGVAAAAEWMQTKGRQSR
jgi:hypothetical protein